MPRNRKGHEAPPGQNSVEIQRLEALVDTQRRHIEELNKQLQETLVSRCVLPHSRPNHGLLTQHINCTGGQQAATTAASGAVSRPQECATASGQGSCRQHCVIKEGEWPITTPVAVCMVTMKYMP